MRKWYEIFFRPKGVYQFLLKHHNNGSRVLDVGSGNDSAARYKTAFGKIYYIGLDVANYNNNGEGFADEEYFADPEEFADAIMNVGEVDAIVSRHNIEHCNEPFDVLIAMAAKLRLGGELYLAFPNPSSVSFPSRAATLNYHDDATHRSPPIDPLKVVTVLKENGMEIRYLNTSYKPALLWFVGLIQEPFSAYFKKVLQGTWAFYGFEVVIWARKIKVCEADKNSLRQL